MQLSDAVMTLLVLVIIAAPMAPVVGDGSSGTAHGTVSAQQTATPDIRVQPESILFPADTDGTATRTLTMQNVGNATLTVRSIVVVGPDRTSFEHSFDGPTTIDPGDQRAVTVSFTAADAQPHFATMHVLSDDPNAPQVNVWLTNTRTVADVSPSRVLQRKTLVNATVQNATANTTQSLNISWPLTRDDVVAVDALSFTPTRSGDLTLSVATNTSRFGDVPAFELDDGTEPAGFVHVDHSIANENVRNVTFTVRVRKDRLAGNETGPEDVALYRYEADTWTELPTRFVAESDTHYFFEASAPGLSDFTAGIKQAKFQITDAVVTVTRIRTDEGTTVLVRVRNVGGADGTYAVRLLLEDDVVDRQELSIAPNGTRQATFDRSFDRPGTYEVYVNDRFVGNVTVQSATTVTRSDESTRTPTVDESPTVGSGPGFDGSTAVVALLIVALLLGVSRRQ